MGLRCGFLFFVSGEHLLRILSLFDGMSCAQIALNRLGIKNYTYFASEVDKYAMSVTQHNFPNTVQLGDIRHWRSWELEDIDLIIGGSPCQGLSRSGKQEGLVDDRSALLWYFVDIVSYYQDATWVLENVVPRHSHWTDRITETLGLQPVLINSKLVSAQSRNRLYWSSIDFPQPADKGISIYDILEADFPSNINTYVPETYYRTPEDVALFRQKVQAAEKNAQNGLLVMIMSKRMERTGVLLNKSLTLESTNWKGLNRSQHQTAIIDLNGDDIRMRQLTPLESERLQTVPDNYTNIPHPFFKNKSLSNTQRYKMLGNAFTVDVISHILSYDTKTRGYVVSL